MKAMTWLPLALAAAIPAAAQTAPATSDDPYLWLEQKDSPRALQWVEAENAKTLPRLEGDRRYQGFYQDALKIASAEDRIPYPSQTGGRILNFWRDQAHPHGIWRWTTDADYATADPHWTTLLDVDALGKAEGKNWVFKGATCLQPEERYCLVSLSDGGEDAVSVREFDLQTGQFVAGGFSLPKSKQDVAWIDRDTILVSRDWGAGTMTQSGYPFVLKLLQARAAARVGDRSLSRRRQRPERNRRIDADRRQGPPRDDHLSLQDVLRLGQAAADAEGRGGAADPGKIHAHRHGRWPRDLPDQRELGRGRQDGSGRRAGFGIARRYGGWRRAVADRDLPARPAPVDRRRFGDERQIAGRLFG